MLLALMLLAPAGRAAEFFAPPGFGDPLGAVPGLDAKHAKIEAQFAAAKNGRPARLFITATIEPNWYIYSITQKPGGPKRTVITVDESKDFRLAGPFVAHPAPAKKVEPLFDNLVIETHKGMVTWHAPLELSAGVDPAKLKISGKVAMQVCDPGACIDEEHAWSASLGPGVEAPTEEPAAAEAAKTPAEETAAAPLRLDRDALVVEASEQIKQFPIALAIAMGFLGGLILNLMPCVLPVIGLKIMSFMEQAGHDRRQALLLNVWYSLGLLAVFLLLAGLAAFAGFGWGYLFTLEAFTITLTAVVFAMGLSFLGVWEIPIPGFVGRGRVLEAAEKEGAAGAFLKGALTTVLATPCSAPFLAPALTWTASQPAPQTFAVFAAAGLGMASPYLLIGAFPRLIRFLPKPGEWMDSFKQVMGFVLLGTVIFLLTFMRLTSIVPTVALLFGLWGALWWIGRTPATAESGVKARRWLEAAAFAGIVWLIAFPGLDKVLPIPYAFGLQEKSQKVLERAIDQGIADRMAAIGSSAVPKTTEAERSNAELPWKPFTRRTLDEAIAGGQTVLVDFTADWCLTCKALEAGVLNTRPVREAVDAKGVLTLRADWTHGDPEVTQMLELLGSKQVPVVAIFPAGNPNRPIVLLGGYTRQTVLDALEKAGPSQAQRAGAASKS